MFTNDLAYWWKKILVVIAIFQVNWHYLGFAILSVFPVFSEAYSTLYAATYRHSEINLIFSKFYKIVPVLSVIETKNSTENASSRDRFGFGGNYKSE